MSMSDPSPSATQNFEQWLAAYQAGQSREFGLHDNGYDYDNEDMFRAWVGGAIFSANKFFNPTVPPTILPDIFRDHDVPD